MQSGEAEQVASVVSHFYTNYSRDVDAQLTAFQHSNAAWIVALQLINHQKPEVQYFAASTLDIKIKKDWSSIDNTGKMELQQNILMALTTHSAGRQSNVVSRLCSALANIAIHSVPDGWPDMVPQLVASIGASPNEVMIELLEALPAQLMDAMITRDRWRIVETTFNQSIQQVLDLMQFLLTNHTTNTSMVYKTLKCLDAWIQFGVSLNELFQRPLINPLFQIIELRMDQNTFRKAIEVVGDIFVNSVMVHHSVALLAICKRVADMNEMLAAALREDNIAVVQDLMLLATSVAENQAHILSMPHAEAIAICDFIVLGMSSPHWEIAETTFEFWFKLQDHLTRIKTPAFATFVPASKILAEQSRDTARKSQYIPRFVQAIQALLRLIQFPSDSELRTWEVEDFDELRLKRESAADIFVSASLIMESEILAVAAAMLGELIAGYKANPGLAAWQPIEVVLYMTQTVVGWHHTVDENLHLIFNIFTELPNVDRVVSMMLTLIGVSAQWLKSRPELLGMSLSYVLAALERDYATTPTSANIMSTVPSGAPQALLDLASICGGQMTDQISTIIKVYESVVRNVDAQGKCTVIRALTHIVSHLPPEHIGDGIKWMVAPITARLDEVFANPEQWEKEIPAIRAEITLLSCAIPFHVEPTTPEKTLAVSQAFPVALVWPYIKRLLQKWHKHALILEAGLEFFSLVFEFFHVYHCISAFEEFLDIALYVYRADRYPMVLDFILSVVETILGKNTEGASEAFSNPKAAIAGPFRAAFEIITSETIPVIKQEAGSVGDLTQWFYKFVGEAIEQFPEIFVSSPALPAIVETALIELSLPAQQVGASQAVVDSLVKMTMSFDKEWGGPVHQLFSKYGNMILRLVLTSLAGNMPWHSFNPLADVLWNLLAEFKAESRMWLCETLLDGASPENAENKALHNMIINNSNNNANNVNSIFGPIDENVKRQWVESMLACKSHRKFRGLISDFAITCRSRTG